MATSYWNKRRQSGGAGAGTTAYMAGLGRAPSFDAEGNVRGFRSRPGATPSPRNTGTLGIQNEFGGGLTPDAEWDRVFGSRTSGRLDNKTPAAEWDMVSKREPIIPDPDMSSVPGNPEMFNPVQFGLAADVPQDAEAMAADLGDFQYQGDVPPVGEMSADDYLNDAISENESWFGSTGQRIAAPTGPTEGGTAFRSKYGRGTVDFNSRQPSGTYAARLKRLGEASIYDL